MLPLRLVVGVSWVEVALECFDACLDIEDEGDWDGGGELGCACHGGDIILCGVWCGFIPHRAFLLQTKITSGSGGGDLLWCGVVGCGVIYFVVLRLFGLLQIAW